jgi:recombination protein RecT
MSQELTTSPDKRVLETRRILEEASKQIINALPQHLRERDPKAERFRRIVLSLVNAEGMDKIAPQQFAIGAIRAAEIGLEPDPIFGQLYLIPFGNVLQPLIGYRGMIELARRSGAITSVRANLVWPGDEFEYETGWDVILRHRPRLSQSHSPADFDKPETMPVCAYAVAVPRDSVDRIVAVLPPYEILRRKARSRSANNAKSPWKNDPAAMWLKSSVRELAKWMPQCQQLATALSIEGDDKDSLPPTSSTIDAPWWKDVTVDQQKEQKSAQTKTPDAPTADPQPTENQPTDAPTDAPTNGDTVPLSLAQFSPGERNAIIRNLWSNHKIRPDSVDGWLGTFQGTKDEALVFASSVRKGA